MRKDTRRTRDRTVDTRKVRNRIRHNDVADAFSRQGEGFAVGVADNRIVVKKWNVWNGQTVINDLAIGFIRDDKDRMPELRFLFA